MSQSPLKAHKAAIFVNPSLIILFSSVNIFFLFSYLILILPCHILSMISHGSRISLMLSDQHLTAFQSPPDLVIRFQDIECLIFHRLNPASAASVRFTHNLDTLDVCYVIEDTALSVIRPRCQFNHHILIVPAPLMLIVLFA